MDRTTDGDQPGRGSARHGLRGDCVLVLLAVFLALGCRSTPRVLDPQDRKLDAPPLTHDRDDEGEETAPGKDHGAVGSASGDGDGDGNRDGDGNGSESGDGD